MLKIFFKFENFGLRNIFPLRDSEEYFRYMNADAFRIFVTANEIPKSVEDAMRDLNYWQNVSHIDFPLLWAITDVNDKMIGTVGANYYHDFHHRIDLSYDLDVNFWGKGIMTKALDIYLETVKNNMTLKRSQANVFEGNFGSIKVLEKLGFQKESLIQSYAFLNGNYSNYFLYGRIWN